MSLNSQPNNTNSIAYYDITVQNHFCWDKQKAIYHITVTLSYDKKNHSKVQMLKKNFQKCFFISYRPNIEN